MKGHSIYLQKETWNGGVQDWTRKTLKEKQQQKFRSPGQKTKYTTEERK